ncbi:MAG: PIG-L deacetylase family protein [Thermodesulfobacteriota bacterium]
MPDFSPSETCVFLAAHPDDEVFIAGTVRTLLRAGVRVQGVWCTSGDYFGQGALREKEVHRAADILGLPESARHLLRFPDLGLVRELERAADRVAEIFADCRPGSVFCTAFEGGHPDHDCVNFLAVEACRRSGLTPDLYEYPLYNSAGPARYWYWQINTFPRQDGELVYTPLDSDAIDCKYRMMKAYSSQWMYMIPARLASSKSRLSVEGERYLRVPLDRDHTIRPHPGTLHYERLFCAFMKIRFPDFRDAVKKCLHAAEVR